QLRTASPGTQYRGDKLHPGTRGSAALSAGREGAWPRAAPPGPFVTQDKRLPRVGTLLSPRPSGTKDTRWGALGCCGPAPGTMHFLSILAILFYLWGITVQGQNKETNTEEVKIEVLHRPENCSKTSKKGDLLNAHYDGYLAKDGSKFYCSLCRKQDST
uniref:Uncharacterized protein n=1 Tax=Castor canadensis TaxID=51338 RepID=A0A8C0VWR5_CASCN